MASKKVYIDVVVDDKGTTQKVAMSAKKLRKSLADAGDATEKTGKKVTKSYRNMQGAAQNSANGTKNFAKTAQGLDGIVPIYATFAANVFAVSAAFGVLRRNAALKQLEQGLIAVGSASGTFLPAIAQDLKDITGAAISTEQALKATSLAVSAGFSGDQLKDLTIVASGAAKALGRDVGDALDRLVRGTAKLEPEILDELGILVRLDSAAIKYAATIGKTANELTQFEKQQAFLNATIEQGQKKFGELNASIDTNAYDQLSASFTEITRTGLDAIGKVLNPLISFLASSPTALVGVLGSFGATLVKQITPAVQDIIEGKNFESSSLAKKAKKDAKSAKKEYKKASKEIRSFSYFPKGVTKFNEAIKDGTISIAELKKREDALNKSITNRTNNLKTLKGVSKDASEARIRTLKEELLLNKQLIALRSTAAKSSASQIFTQGKSAQAAAAANATGLIASSGPLAGLKEAAKGIGQQFTVIGKSGAKGLTALRLGASAASKSIGLLGTAIGGLIGPLSIGILLFSTLKPLFDKFFAKKDAEADKLKALEENFNALKTAVAGYTNEIKDSEASSDRYFKTLKIGTGLAQSLVDDLSALAAAATEEAIATKQAAEARIPILEKEAAAIERQALAIKERGVRTQADFAILQQYATLRGRLQNASEDIIEAEERIGTVSRESALESLSRNITLFKSNEVLATQYKGLLSVLEAIKEGIELTPELDNIDVKALEVVSKEAARNGAAIQKFSEAFENNLSNALTEQNKFFSKSKTQFSGYLDSIRAASNEIKSLAAEAQKAEDAGNGTAAESLATQFAELTPEAQAFVERLTGVRELTLESAEAVKEYIQGWDDAQNTIITLNSKLAENKRLQSQISKINLKSNSTVAMGVDLQNKAVALRLDALNKEKERRLELVKGLETSRQTAEVENIRQEFLQREKEILAAKVGEEEKIAMLALNQLDTERQILNFQQQQVTALTSQISSREAITRAALEQANIDARRKDIFADFGSRQDQGEAQRALEAEKQITKGKINAAMLQLDLAKTRSKLEMQVLEAQTRLAMEQTLQIDPSADLQIYDRILSTAKEAQTQTIASAELSAQAQVEAAKQILRSAEDAVVEYGFIETSMRGAAKAFGDGIKDGLVGIVRGTSSLKDALTNLANGILDSIVDSAAEAITNDLLDKIKIESPADKMKAGMMQGGRFTGKEVKDKMQEGAATVKTAIEQGGDTTAAKITQAFADASVDYSVKCCNDSTGAGVQGIQPVSGGVLQGSSTQLPPELGGVSAAATTPVLPAVGTTGAPKGMTDPGAGLDAIGGGDEKEEGGKGISGALASLKESLMENTAGTLLTTSAVTGLLAGVVKNTSASEFLTKVTQALQFATLALKAVEFIRGIFTKLDTKATISNTIALNQNTAAQQSGGSGGGGGLAGLAGMFMAANGGMAKGGFRAFADGGTVNKPTLGMVGEGKYNEAIVPLPDGKSIPVMMEGKSGGQQNNNVTVNVAVSNEGSSTTDTQSDSRQAGELGKRISDAVRLEMQNQKRPGGILSPYGAA